MEDMDLTERDSRPDPTFWNGRRVLITGHTGFKGAWLAYWLHRMGAVVTGLALDASTNPNLFSQIRSASWCTSRIEDIRNLTVVTQSIQEARPEIVLHLAAQALVRASYRLPAETFDTNVMGTVHVLEAIRHCESVRVAIMVTTDKVYRNREWPWPYREEDELGGHDPYSASKAACEAVAESYRLSFLADRGVAIATARSGNVIGGGDWSEERLFPDIVRAWQLGSRLSIRRPLAVRPWQHVLDPLAGYLVLAEQLWRTPHLANAYNFGPTPERVASVREIVCIAKAILPQLNVEFSGANDGPHEGGVLTLDNSRARKVLGVRPRFALNEAVQRTLKWYVEFARGVDACQLCDADISAWTEVES